MSINEYTPMLLSTVNNSIGDKNLHFTVDKLLELFNKKCSEFTELEKYAVDTITVDGVEITKDRVVGEYNIFKFTLNGSSEQKITIHSYEYIMYEDINQPVGTK